MHTLDIIKVLLVPVAFESRVVLGEKERNGYFQKKRKKKEKKKIMPDFYFRIVFQLTKGIQDPKQVCLLSFI